MGPERGACGAVAGLAEAIAAALLLLVVLLNLAQVGFRYLLGDPLGWTEEAMRIGAVWLTFLAAAAALRRGEHPALDLPASLAPPGARRAAALLALAATGGFAALLLWEGAVLVETAAGQSSPAAELPMGWAYAAVPAGGGLMLIATLCLVRAALRGDGRA